MPSPANVVLIAVPPLLESAATPAGPIWSLGRNRLPPTVHQEERDNERAPASAARHSEQIPPDKEKGKDNNNTLTRAHEWKGASVEELLFAAGRRHTQTAGVASVTAD